MEGPPGRSARRSAGSSTRSPTGTGILLPDPADLKAFGRAVRLLLGDQAEATRMGQAAHSHVREHYLGDIHLMRYASLLGTLLVKA